MIFQLKFQWILFFKREKNNAEKEEMKKAIFKIQGKESQFQHELRKKDALLKKCQEQIEKIQNDKKKLYYNNNFEITQGLDQNGPNLFSNNVFEKINENSMINSFENILIISLKIHWKFIRNSNEISMKIH